MIKKAIFPLFIALLMQGVVVEAQTGFKTNFIQSRYIDSPFRTTCSECDLAGDGITHIRFDPASAKLIEDGGKNFVKFKVQIRATGGVDDARYISAAAFRLRYDNAVFGDRLGTAADGTVAHPNTDGSGDPTPQCTYEKSSFFAQQVLYSLVFNDTDPVQFNINERHGLQAVLIKAAAPESSFLRLGEEWTDLVTLTCEIPAGKTDNEAGFGIAGSQPRGIFYRRYTDDDPVNAVPTTAFLIADNDLRGFRLDGKTWAEDYARYSDGTGVRVQFSKGIRDALTNDDFTLDGVDPADVAIANVVHSAGSRYARIEFDKVAESGVLRLASTDTATIVYDVENNALADKNFVASLYYDADAPVASVEMIAPPDDNAISQWKMTFDKPVRTDTINEDHLCVTEANGVCADQRITSSTVSITSVNLPSDLAFGATTTTEITMMIDEGEGKVGGMRSIEFRRNAVLGEDLKIVEDYQTGLRNQLEITDIQPPRIVSVVAEGPAIPNPNDPHSYSMSFVVTSDEDINSVTSLDKPGSYLLIGLRVNGTTLTIAGVPTVEELAATSEGFPYRVSYVNSGTGAVNIPDIADIQSITGFTLARKGSKLTDLGGNAPVDRNETEIGSQGRLDPDSGAVATRDRTAPQLQVFAIKRQVGNVLQGARPTIGNGNEYTMEFQVAIDNNRSVPTLDDIASYRLIHISTANTRTSVASMASETASVAMGTLTVDEASISVLVEGETVTVKYVVDFDSMAATRLTQGFALGRVADALLDTYSNKPVDSRAGGMPVIGTDDGDAINSADVATAFRDTEPPKYILTGVSSQAEGTVDGINVDDVGYDLSINMTLVGGIDFPIVDFLNLVHLLRVDSDDNYHAIDNSNIGGENSVTSGSSESTHFYRDVVLSAEDARNTKGFTLGLQSGAMLVDYANNPIVDSNPSGSGDPLTAGQPFDTRDAAIAERNQIGKPLTVVANNVAVPVSSGSSRYKGSFTITADSDAAYGIPTLAEEDSYSLLRIKNDNTLVPITARTTATEVIADRKATVAFEADLGSAMNIMETQGFTLARTSDAGLIDYSSNPPILSATTTTEVGVGERIDLRDEAIAPLDKVQPVVSVVADGGAVPADDNGNRYTMTFKVSSTKPLIDIGTAASYKLLHLETADGTAIADLSSLIQGAPSISMNNDSTTATISYVVEFSQISDTQMTRGFTLGRGGTGLQDSSFNAPKRDSTAPNDGATIATDGRIDLRDAAIAERDTEGPLMMVTEATALPDQTNNTLYDVSFKVTPSESVRDLETPDSYALLQVLDDGTYVLITGVSATVTPDGSAVTVEFDDVTFTNDDANPTVGFTLARGGIGLRDLANNDPVTGTNALLGVTDRSDTTLAEAAQAELQSGIRIRARVFLEGAVINN